MGWGYQTNETIKIINDKNFIYDSSAIPRPKYPFEISIRDCEETPQYPYRPSFKDYLIPASPSYNILEIPITTVPLSTPTDTLKMHRCISPGLKNKIFKKTILACRQSNIVLAAHPYEIVTSNKNHFLNSYSIEEFNENLLWLSKQNFNFATLKDISNLYPNHS